MSDLTLVDVERGLASLTAAGYGKELAGPAALARAREFFDLLVPHGVTLLEFQGAIAAFKDSDETYFPKPWKLKQLALRNRNRTAESGSLVNPDECPDCRGPYYHAGFVLPTGEVAPRLRCRCARHHTSWRWSDPRALAWREG